MDSKTKTNIVFSTIAVTFIGMIIEPIIWGTFYICWFMSMMSLIGLFIIPAAALYFMIEDIFRDK